MLENFSIMLLGVILKTRELCLKFCSKSSNNLNDLGYIDALFHACRQKTIPP